MAEIKYTLQRFRTDNGRVPFTIWFRKLDTRAAARILARLNRIALGNLGDVTSLNEGLYEFRLDFGPGYRIYFAIPETDLILLILGGYKKSQSRDILRARGFLRRFNERE